MKCILLLLIAIAISVSATAQLGATLVWDSAENLQPGIPHIGVFVIPGFRFPSL